MCTLLFGEGASYSGGRYFRDLLAAASTIITESPRRSGPRNGWLIVCGFTHENEFQNGGRTSSSLLITCIE